MALCWGDPKVVQSRSLCIKCCAGWREGVCPVPSRPLSDVWLVIPQYHLCPLHPPEGAVRSRDGMTGKVRGAWAPGRLGFLLLTWGAERGACGSLVHFGQKWGSWFPRQTCVSPH